MNGCSAKPLPGSAGATAPATPSGHPDLGGRWAVAGSAPNAGNLATRAQGGSPWC